MLNSVSLLVALAITGGSSPLLQDGAAQTKEAKAKPELKVGNLGLPAFKGARKRVIVSGIEVKVNGVATSAPTPSGTTTVVTLDLDQPTEFGTGLTEMLMTALIESERFVVLERLNLADTTTEAANAGKTQRLAGAQIVIRGAITELKMRRSGAGVDGVIGENAQFSKTSVEAIVGLDLRMIEVETGIVLDSVRAEGKATSTRQNLTLAKDELKFGTASFDNGPLGGAVRSALRDAVKKIALRAEKVIWEGRVATVTTEGDVQRVYVNAGKNSGLSVGDVMVVRKPGTVITDPETEAVLGRTEGAAVGKIKIVEVNEAFSVAVVTEGAGFERGDVVRLANQTP